MAAVGDIVRGRFSGKEYLVVGHTPRGNFILSHRAAEIIESAIGIDIDYALVSTEGWKKYKHTSGSVYYLIGNSPLGSYILKCPKVGHEFIVPTELFEKEYKEVVPEELPKDVVDDDGKGNTYTYIQRGNGSVGKWVRISFSGNEVTVENRALASLPADVVNWIAKKLTEVS